LFPDTVDVDDVVEEYIQNAYVDTALADSTASQFYFTLPNDQYFENQWYLYNTGDTLQHTDSDGVTDIDAPEAWEFTDGDNQIVVAIIDSGIKRSHPDFDGQLWENEAEVNGQNNVDDDNNGYVDDRYGFDPLNAVNDYDPDISGVEAWHGMNCAGLIATKNNNSEGVSGAAPACRLMAIRNALESATPGAILQKCILYAADNGARVISMSIGFGPTDRNNLAPQLAMQDVASHHNDVIFAVAAGNGDINDGNNDNDYNFTAFGNRSAPDVKNIRMPVANICAGGLRVPSSSTPLNQGTTTLQKMSVGAPGGGSFSGNDTSCFALSEVNRFASDNLSSVPEGSPIGWYDAHFGGTSMATPLVASIAGLLFSDDPSMTAATAKYIIEQSAIDITQDPRTQTVLTGWDRYTGYGIANANRALLYPMLLSPTPSGTYWGGDTLSISWRIPKTHSNKDTCSVAVSFNGGTTFQSILSNATFAQYPGALNWVVPDTVNADQVLLRVTARHDPDGVGGARYSVSTYTDTFVIKKTIKGTISSNTTWSSQTVISGDLEVANNKTLTIAAGTIVQCRRGDALSAGDDASKCEIVVKGTLDVNGSTNSPVRFELRGGGPGEGEWYGVRVPSGGVLQLDHAEVKHATYGVLSKTRETSHIQDCSFSLNEVADIYSTISSGTPALTVQANSVTVGGGIGIELVDKSSGITVEANTVIGSAASTSGIEVTGSGNAQTPLIKNNDVSGFSGGAGISFTTSTASVIQNDCSSSKWGIHVTGGSTSKPDIGATSSSDKNTITSNTNGVLVEDSSTVPKIRYNHITGNTYGIHAKNGGDPDAGTSSSNKGNNNLSGNTTYCLINRNTNGSPQLRAQGNYFGGCDPLPVACWDGNVDVNNYLCSAPAGYENVEIGVLGKAKELRIVSMEPNPAPTGTAIRYAVEGGSAQVEMFIFNVSGRVVRSYGKEDVFPGLHEFYWNGEDASGVRVGRGVYFVRITSTNRLASTAKLLVVR